MTSKFTLIKRIEGLNHLVINQHGFPLLFTDREEANLERIEQQMTHNVPVLVYETKLRGAFNE